MGRRYIAKRGSGTGDWNWMDWPWKQQYEVEEPWSAVQWPASRNVADR